jgi:hypothetical protein
MDCETIRLKLTGTKRLLMHNGQLADPLAAASRALARLTGKRNKTLADHEEIGRVEWNGGLWLDSGRPCIPAEALMSSFTGAAKLSKRGDEARAGMVVEANAILAYDGPQNLDELWLDERFRLRAGVRVRSARTMRTRPKFDDWSVEFTANYLPSLLDKSFVFETWQTAGFVRGIGDWRPVNGTYEVTFIG